MKRADRHSALFIFQAVHISIASNLSLSGKVGGVWVGNSKNQLVFIDLP
jgi:hypothetical protein